MEKLQKELVFMLVLFETFLFTNYLTTIIKQIKLRHFHLRTSSKIETFSFTSHKKYIKDDKTLDNYKQMF